MEANFSFLRRVNFVKVLNIFFILVCLFINAIEVNSAEVLQVNNSSLISIGDNNRAYKVKVACIEIDFLNEEKASKWMKSNLNRHQKVNLRPMGSEDGFLLARVFRIGSEKDIGEELSEAKLARYSCG